MKSIFQINVVVNTGSTGRIVEEIGQLALLNGYKSYIAYGRKALESKSELIRIGNEVDILCHGLKTRVLDRHGFGSQKATLQLIKQISQINPSIIHLHNIHGYYINIKVLFDYLKKNNKPVVWTLHDCWPFTGHCAYFDMVNCVKWKIECTSCPQTREYPKSLMIDNSYSNYKDKNKIFNSVENLNLVAVSTWLSGLLENSFLKGVKRQVIKNGINLKIFTPQKKSAFKKMFNIEDKTMLLGVASNWGKRKGLEDFIKLSDIIDYDTVIVLVGVDDNIKNALPLNIIGITHTENVQELVDIYSSADLFLNLTYEDNYPTTNLEALACGTPVLTYKTGGSQEAINEQTGFIVTQGRLFDVLDVVNQVKNHSKEFFNDKCRSYAIANHNKDDRLNEYISLYDNMLK